MSPFSIAIAQGIAGLPALSGAGFRIFMWLVITTLACGFLLLYARKIKANPEASPSFHSDAFFRSDQAQNQQGQKPFLLGHKIILLEMLLGLVWIVYGVM